MGSADDRPLPDGWLKQWDSNYNQHFYVDTRATPPRSVWTLDEVFKGAQPAYAPPPGPPPPLKTGQDQNRGSPYPSQQHPSGPPSYEQADGARNYGVNGMGGYGGSGAGGYGGPGGGYLRQQQQAVPAQGYGYPQQPPLPQQQMPYGAGYPQQPMHGGYMQGGYPQQPMVMQQQPMYQQSRGRMGGGGMGGMGAGVLGAGAGLLGGMMIMDAM
ncbi:hypothetical protein DMC30DRAFT_134166 [Rhodotorula diobovata]|uniref:Uncharacterized protein n=1 Tax=Rhodotorula diobovata TaxID=5288 RepID=A0A5C5G2C4_9BASI|nr:hypothetical protein DMC30DRAFT_134166 [Rhodotorula diobovata]